MVHSVNSPPDLARQYTIIEAEVSDAVLGSGLWRYIGGSAGGFEQQFAAYLSVSGGSCNSGTDALYLALRALEIGPGDEVITTPFTFCYWRGNQRRCNACFVDIDQTFNIDAGKW